MKKQLEVLEKSADIDWKILVKYYNSGKLTPEQCCKAMTKYAIQFGIFLLTSDMFKDYGFIDNEVTEIIMNAIKRFENAQGTEDERST